MIPESNKEGILPKIFGLILIFLGGMNCMLAWRGSFEVNLSFVFLIVVGIALFCFGVIRAASRGAP